MKAVPMSLHRLKQRRPRNSTRQNLKSGVLKSKFDEIIIYLLLQALNMAIGSRELMIVTRFATPRQKDANFRVPLTQVVVKLLTGSTFYTLDFSIYVKFTYIKETGHGVVRADMCSSFIICGNGSWLRD